MRRAHALLAAGILVLVVLVLVLVARGPAATSTATEGGIRWTLRGSRLEVVVTPRTPPAVARRIRGRRLRVTCYAVGPGDRRLADAERATTNRTFSGDGPTVVDLPFAPHDPDGCVLEPAGDPADVAAVAFDR